MNLAPSAFLSRRVERVRAAMAAASCDALAVTHRPNVFYLSNFSASAGALLISASRAHLVVDSRYVTEAREMLTSGRLLDGLELVEVEHSHDETVAGLLLDMAPAAAGFEAEHLTFGRYAWLKTSIEPRVSLRPTSGLVESLRVCKDGYEIEVLREGARRLSALLPRVLGGLAAGVSERQVAATIEAAMRSSGFSGPAFDTIVASGTNGALPHAVPAGRLVCEGDLVVIDFGGVLDGYCVDLTRTVSIGRASAEARRVHGAVEAARAAAIAAIQPGVLAGDIDAAARSVLETRGLGAAFGHATGHGLGLEVHEAPRIARFRAGGTAGDASRAGWSPIVPGMVFTVEPGAYIPGWGGVRIEDDVLVTEMGCEVLTTASRELIEL